MLSAAAREILSDGFAGVLGTRDEANRPDCTWVFGARLSDSGNSLRLFVVPAAAEISLENVASNGRMAFTMTRPQTDRSAQVKGQFLGRSVMDAKDREAQAAWFEKFTFETTSVGCLPEAISQVTFEDSVVLEMRVEEAYSQTPGPEAGKRL